MKAKITIAAILISGCSIAQNAEIVNGFDSFETWTSAEVGELPQYWDGFNKNVFFGPSIVGTVECIEKSSTDPYEGIYSAKLTSTSIMSGPAVPGILTTGNLLIDWDAQDGDITGGEAYIQRPTILTGQFKYAPVGVDTGFVSIWFMQNGIEVGRGRYEFTQSTSAWTEFNVLIDYDMMAAPDSMNIIFSSSLKENGFIPEGTILEIDAISFGSYLAVTDLESLNYVCYPNPSHDVLTIRFEEQTRGTVQLIASDGAIVRTQIIEGNSVTMNVEDLAKGVYSLVVNDDQGIRNETIIIN